MNETELAKEIAALLRQLNIKFGGQAADEIERLRKERDDIDQLKEYHQQLIAELQRERDRTDRTDRADAARRECMADAARYRWLRGMDAKEWDAFFGSLDRDATHEKLDAAIDAAMERGE